MARLNLPSAKRTVSRGVGVCGRMGYTEAEALGLIMTVCAGAERLTKGQGEYDLTWLAEVQEVARCRLNRLRPPPS